MYSYFSKIQHDIESVKKALLFSSKVLSFFVLPIGVGIFIIKAPLVNLLFGEKWQGLDFVVGILAVQQSLSWIVGLNSFAYSAVGRPDVETKILVLSVPVFLVVYIISAQISFQFFILCRLLLLLFGFIVHFYFSAKLFRTKFFEFFINIRLILLLLLPIVILNYLYTSNKVMTFLDILLYCL
jgi:O-antigen/teichoic acid export membrane protein